LPSDEHVVVRSGYVSSINFRLRIPNWVAERYTATDKDGEGVDRKHSRFSADEAVPAEFRATNEDYRGSNLSRGHLAPAGAHKQSQETLNETFLLSDNILPQELSNNGSDWLRLERWSRALTKHWPDVFVVSGPLFLPAESGSALTTPTSTPTPVPTPAPMRAEDDSGTRSRAASPRAAPPLRRTIAYDVIGERQVAVPSHLFKVVLAEGADGERRLSAFVLPNGPLRGHPDLDDFVVSLVEVERASGLSLFERLGVDRYTTPPLCGGRGGPQSRCGVGAMDGRIGGWKHLGHLKLADDCRALAEAWSDVEAHGKLDNMGMLRRTREQKARKLACPLSAVPSASPQEI
jgi:DNA/RNA endonuclease G (NUC1)